MSNVGRRLNALEQIAEEVRYRPHRRLAAETGADPDSLIAGAKRFEALRDRLLAEGKSEGEVVEAIAAEVGMDPDELRRRAEVLLERFTRD